MRRSLAVVACTLALAAWAGRAHAAAYVFTAFDAPGTVGGAPYSASTQLYGINDRGQIIGEESTNLLAYRGFVDTAGAFTYIDQAGYVYGINNNGQIVGTIGFNKGFLESNGSFVDVPSSGSGLSIPGNSFIPYGIDDAGRIVGTYLGDAGGTAGGLVLNSNGSATKFNLPIVGSKVLTLTGINNAGQFIGTYYTGGKPFSGFLDSAGTVSVLNVLGARPGSTNPLGISNAGEVTGTYQTTLEYTSHGFVYDNGTYTLLDVPWASATIPRSVNVAGDVVGYYFDATGTHGFLATPVSVPEPGSITVLTLALAVLGLVARRTTA